MAERQWRIGQLATAVGLTVRTLHHYDAIGLLPASGRTEAGHRLYSAADVRRLYQILVLKQLGLGLHQVRTALEGGNASLEAVISRHLQEVERQIELYAALRGQLRLALSALRQAQEPSTEVLIQVMDRMTMLERYLTPEQLTMLKEHRKRLGDEAMERAWQERANLIAALDSARRAGEDPTSTRVQELQRQFIDLHRQFTGDDPEVLSALQRMVEMEGVEVASGGTISAELRAYLGAPGAAGTS